MRVLSVLSFGLVLSCGGQTVDVGWTDEPLAPNSGSVEAKCSAPDGNSLPVPDEKTFLSLLAGRWYRCGPADPSLGPVPDAVEFTASEEWYRLVPDASGAYQRSTAAGESGSFPVDKIIDACCPDSYVLSLDNEVHYDIPSFENAPDRMTWSYEQAGTRTIGARFVR
jgi:hypothetical protein